MKADAVSMTLRAIAGPTAVDRQLNDGGRLSIGRSVGCDLCLADGSVSREHATISWADGAGTVMDLRSVGGTMVNGVRIVPGQPVAIGIGDLIAIGPWILCVRLSSEHPSPVPTLDDTASRDLAIERIDRPAELAGAEQRLQLLIDCIAGFNSACDEQSLAAAAVHAALKGTSFRRAALLRGVSGGESESIEVLASLRRDPGSIDGFIFSRSLVREAMQGHTVALSSRRADVDERSIADIGIQTALCLPIHLAGAVTAVLYLDSRRGERAADPANTSYCEAVARACGLALANLKRDELERRQRVMAQELAAAREAQRMLVASDIGVCGSIRFAAKMRPGLVVAGDLYDVIPLEDGRTGVVIGDVSGRGLGSGIVMAMTQAHLHSGVEMLGDPALALTKVNRFICDRLEGGRFVSIWIGLIAPDGEVLYVDAGHGHARMIGAQGECKQLKSGGDIPLGIDPFRIYSPERCMLRAGERLVLYSDGILEQRSMSGAEFGIERLEAALRQSSNEADDAITVFAALEAFEEGAAPTDDATVVSIALNRA